VAPGASAGRRIELIAPGAFPLIAPGDDLVDAILGALAAERIALRDGDILVLAQKVVSKAEGCYVDLSAVTPSPRALELAAACGKDARLIETILSESTEVMRCRPGVIIVRHRIGIVLANAGIDRSNLPDFPGNEHVLLLPKDPDASAARIRGDVNKASGVEVGVMIIDSLGRAWRVGTCGACIGAAGLPAVLDMRGDPDLFGRALVSTIVGAGDEIAAAASLVMGQAAEGTPLVVVRNYAQKGAPRAARDLIRPLDEDLFT
jgi:coenzyme F420-0:L-glutamate ligase / coenzyme F420-1:gamma-L-glutamate ligase